MILEVESSNITRRIKLEVLEASYDVGQSIGAYTGYLGAEEFSARGFLRVLAWGHLYCTPEVEMTSFETPSPVASTTSDASGNM